MQEANVWSWWTDGWDISCWGGGTLQLGMASPDALGHGVTATLPLAVCARGGCTQGSRALLENVWSGQGGGGVVSWQWRAWKSLVLSQFQGWKVSFENGRNQQTPFSPPSHPPHPPLPFLNPVADSLLMQWGRDHRLGMQLQQQRRGGAPQKSRVVRY